LVDVQKMMAYCSIIPVLVLLYPPLTMFFNPISLVELGLVISINLVLLSIVLMNLQLFLHQNFC
jgi:hypothetical protein